MLSHIILMGQEADTWQRQDSLCHPRTKENLRWPGRRLLGAMCRLGFTGLIFCEVCDSVCYRRKSKNRKGEYHYYGCGCRQRNGPATCSNSSNIREDVLLANVSRAYETLFDDTDSIIQDAMEEARRLLNSNRNELQGAKARIRELDRKIRSLTGLLLDPDIDTTAKKAVSRQMGELESDRERLQGRVIELAEDAGDNTARLAGAVRQSLEDAQESLAAASTPAELRDFIEKFVGPMILSRNGRIGRKTLAPAETGADVKRYVAGAGFEPATFYEERRSVNNKCSTKYRFFFDVLRLILL